MKTTAIYFSPTGTSKRGTCAIARVLGNYIDEIDITIEGNSYEREFGIDEVVVFGAPVYAGRIFKGVKKRLKNIKGNQTPCIVTVTYGNRHYDDALLELADIVTAKGFIPIAGAALIGEHTYGKIQVGRPNSNDIVEDENFGGKVLKKLQSGDRTVINLPGNRPYVHGEEGGSGGRFTPSTDKKCTNCGLCAKQCPQGAIDIDDCSKIDADKCISCFRCIRNCPINAKNVNTEEYNIFAENLSKKLSNPRKNEFFIY
ncbi:4Fe-4S binding protein [Clostridium sp.]|jgi:ferredoxin|uniref:4Fe-4S binding protein n=1 Tax=Clostridium sp. TaxID=1506 RepID=UPI003A5C53FB